MTFLKLTLIGITALSLASCTTTSAQQTYNEMEFALNDIGNSMEKCTEEVSKTSPAYKSVFEIENGEFTSRAFKNKKYVQKSDKKPMQETIDSLLACRENSISRIQNHNNEHVRSFTYLALEAKTLKGEVYKKYINGEITGGQAVTSLQNISKSLEVKWNDQYQIQLGALNRQHFQQQQAQAAMWQAMGSTFQNYNQQQQQYYQQRQAAQQQIRMPVHTSCQWNGGIMNCTSF